MRIIAGNFRGRRLTSVRDHSVRPTTDRAKQTIYDILSNRIDFQGIEVLDLFAGSGSLGLEALSRGAKSVVFIEKSRRALKVLETNIRSLGSEAQCTIHQADVFWFLKNVQRSFDLIFADPPYKLETISTLPDAIYESAAAKSGAFVVMEYSRETPIELSEAKFEMTRKHFGQTVVLILKTRTPSEMLLSN